MNGDDEPITRRELRAELSAFATKQEMRLEIASGMNYVVETIGARFDQMRDDMQSIRVDMVTMRKDLSRDMVAMREDVSREMVTMREDLSREMVTMREDLSREMVTMRGDLSRELAGHVRAAAEENRQFLAVLDDRYRDLPPRVAVLERDLDEHRGDPTLHPRRRRK